MKVFGSITRLVSAVFRKDSNDVTLQPSSSVTYSASRVVELPPQDSNAIIVSQNATQTLTNKTIDAASNTISNIANANISNTAAIAYSKLNLSGAIVNADISTSAAIALSKLAALTASRALVSDGSGFISAATTTATEIGYVNGVTSAIQTQIDGKVAKAGDTMTGNLIMDNNKEVRLRESTGSGTNFIGHKAASTLASDATYSWVIAPVVSGYVLASDTSGNLSWVSNASVSSFKADWDTGDGTSKSITHNLGTTDILVQVFDKTDGQTIEVDTVIRTDSNTLDLTASEAPGAGSWRVLILAV